MSTTWYAPEAPVRARRRRGHLVAVSSLTAVYAVALPLSLLMAMMSPMAADSGVHAGTYVPVLAALALPVVLVVALVLGWVGYRRASTPLVVTMAVLPVADVALGVLAAASTA